MKQAWSWVAAGAVMMAPGWAMAQTPGAPNPQALFDARCKTCHDPAIDRAPSRDDLRQRAPESIVQALTGGVMAPMASGLTPADIRSLAVYLSGKPLAAPAQAAAGGGRGPAVVPASASPFPSSAQCAKDAPIRTTPGDWNGYNKDLTSSRYQKATSLNAGNVDRLKVKWAFSIAGGRYGQPTVIGDHLFLTTFAGEAFSLDARTGCVHWRVALGAGSRTSPIVEQGKGLSPSGWVVYVGDRNRDVWALDAVSGKTVWKTNVETHPRAGLTGAFAYHDGRLYVPTASSEETIATVPDYKCCTFVGAVVALDAKTGKLVWKTKMETDPKPTRKNSAGTQMFGPAGSAIWSQPTIDAKRGQLYVATGDSYTEVDAPHSDSIVALDLKTGAMKWANQVTKADNFLTACAAGRRGINCPLGEIGPDHDFGSSPILATLAGGKQLVLSGQKSGIAYGMDPDTGKLVWSNKLGAGSALGGVEWGMAYDGKTFFVNVSDVVARQDAKPGIHAVDPATGAEKWTMGPKVPCTFTAARCSNGQSAPPAVIPGVVFSGGQDAWLRAYAAGTGRTLWMTDLAGRTYETTNGITNQPGGSVDEAGPVVAGGMLYVISGYTGATGAFGNPLNVLIAYSVDGK